MSLFRYINISMNSYEYYWKMTGFFCTWLILNLPWETWIALRLSRNTRSWINWRAVWWTLNGLNWFVDVRYPRLSNAAGQRSRPSYLVKSSCLRLTDGIEGNVAGRASRSYLLLRRHDYFCFVPASLDDFFEPSICSFSFHAFLRK